MTDPTTASGRALLEAFTARAIDAPDAIHLNAESIIRHAIPRIEAEAYERGCVAGMAMEKFAATPDPLAPHPGENHDYRMACLSCGEPGHLFVGFCSPGETFRWSEAQPKEADRE